MAGVHLVVRPADVDESPGTGERPVVYVARVARSKFDAVAATQPGQIVVAADTTVDLDDAVLGKPVDAADARSMLRALSGRAHRVHTAVVVGWANQIRELVVTTEVTFGELTDGDIDAYVATGEPLDKAGSYAIQGAGGALIARIDGSPTNVIGLPLRETLTLISTLAADRT